MLTTNWTRGESYESYVGRWSRVVAGEFLKWLNVPDNSQWLDVGCGTGALSEVILKTSSPSSVKGIDPASAYVAFANQNLKHENVSFEVGDAENLNDADNFYDAAVSGLVLNFVPHPEKMIAEMKRVSKSGGTVACYVWDYSENMQIMRHFWNTAVKLDASAAALDEGVKFKICKPELLRDLFQKAGLQNVETRAVDAQAIFKNFDDFWSPFLGGQAPAPSYAMSLSVTKRNELRDLIHSNLPVASDGSIKLLARVWAVKGIK